MHENLLLTKTRTHTHICLTVLVRIWLCFKVAILRSWQHHTCRAAAFPNVLGPRLAPEMLVPGAPKMVQHGGWAALNQHGATISLQIWGETIYGLSQLWFVHKSKYSATKLAEAQRLVSPVRRGTTGNNGSEHCSICSWPLFLLVIPYLCCSHSPHKLETGTASNLVHQLCTAIRVDLPHYIGPAFLRFFFGCPLLVFHGFAR